MSLRLESSHSAGIVNANIGNSVSRDRSKFNLLKEYPHGKTEL